MFPQQTNTRLFSKPSPAFSQHLLHSAVKYVYVFRQEVTDFRQGLQNCLSFSEKWVRAKNNTGFLSWVITLLVSRISFLNKSVEKFSKVE